MINECIKLTPDHKDLFFNFINEQIKSHNLQNDFHWQNIKFIEPNRHIYAVLKNKEIQAIVAGEDLPNMPWVLCDTLLARKDQSHFANFKNILKVMQFQLNECESRGKWGFFWVRSEDIERANKERNTHNVQGLDVSKYGKKYASIYEEKYNVTDAAFVKAGHLTGNKLYDYCLGNKPLPYDSTIRFITMKIKYTNTIMRDKITYGA